MTNKIYGLYFKKDGVLINLKVTTNSQRPIQEIKLIRLIEKVLSEHDFELMESIKKGVYGHGSFLPPRPDRERIR